MTDASAIVYIEPVRDSNNSHPYGIDFYVNQDGTVQIDIDGRYLTFNISDFERVIKIYRAME